MNHSSSPPTRPTAKPSPFAHSPCSSSTAAPSCPSMGLVLISSMVVARDSRPKLLASTQERKVFRVPKRSCDVVGGKGARAGAVSEIDTADIVRHLRAFGAASIDR